MVDINILMKVGLTQNEARTYRTLLQLGSVKTGPLCDKLKIPSSHIYNILNTLKDKGLVTFTTSNNIRIYSANKPETLTILHSKKQVALEEEQEQIQDLIKILNKLPINNNQGLGYKYFEGISGFKAMWLEINDILTPNTEAVVFTSKLEGWKTLEAFYLEHHQIRVKKNVYLKIILPKGATKYGEERKKIGKCAVRYLDLDNHVEFGAYEDFMHIQYPSGKTPRAFLIKDPLFSLGFKSIFNHLWKQAK